ncbi:MAG: 30S ribosomal protein S16 [Clostridiales bacterium]|nr:30S ribosomal protein S16 [Clostridiales bacterium]
MVKIRLKRIGAKKNPFYRIVVADGRYPRNGKCIEEIGTYDPLKNPPLINVNLEKAYAWVKNGAQPTDTVKSILKRAETANKKESVTA